MLVETSLCGPSMDKDGCELSDTKQYISFSTICFQICFCHLFNFSLTYPVFFLFTSFFFWSYFD